MDFRILGPLEARAGGEPVALGGDKQRALLALMLLHANEALSSDRLIDELWGEERPAGAAKALQVSVSRLRKALAQPELVITREHGYELRIDPAQLDAHRFERDLAEGRGALADGRPQRAAETLEAALSHWRGRPLDDLAYEPFAQRAIGRLEDLRVAALEQLIEARLALGRHAEVLGDLEALIGEHPHREGLRAQLMLALYRCDRQADALQAYQDARRSLVEELGIEPGSRLRELERAILAQAPELAAPAVAAPAAPGAAVPAGTDGAQAARRLLSVVFVDLSMRAERLDPEARHSLLDRCADVCSAVIERHGGTVAPSIGEAVVGVFGQVELHEDDALRAVRAAVELRAAGTELGMRLGVESGEAFVGAGVRRAPFATGSAFDVAARLARAAPPSEILLGDGIHRMLSGAVRAEPAAAGQPAWRLLALNAGGEAIARTSTRPFVGRQREQEQLRTAFARVRDEQGCAAVTVVGPAGIGKSRLAHELIAEVADDATVVVGRCPSYGEGVTYRPLAEIVGRLGGADPRQWVGELFDGDEAVAQMVLAAIGLADGTAQAEETFWAVRRMFERVARERPLVVVVEDVHWAESTLLDLLDYLVAVTSGHALLLVCLARPELLETRPAWVAPRPNRSTVVLEALSDAEAHLLVEHAEGIGSGTATRIVERAEGNPLFLEHLAAMGAEHGDAALPSSIQAVLAARIHRLAPGERALVEHASVQGQSFHAGALEALLPEDGRAGITAHLVALVHKQLIRAERSELPGMDAFRFAHALIREAAYRSLPKQRRAELHERVARWLESQAGVQDETIGHHLGEAHRHGAELGRAGPHQRALAAAAAARLATAADAALLRGDPAAGAHLLERAASLLEGEEPARSELLPALGGALFEAGRLADAARVLDQAIARAPEPSLRARAEVERELVRLETEPGSVTPRARRVVDAALPVLRAGGDERGHCRAWLLSGQLAWHVGHVGRADAAFDMAARTAGGRHELFDVIGWRALAAVLGPTPVDEAIRRCEAFRALVRASPIATASTLNPLALLHAMKGEPAIAERLLEQAGETLRELGGFSSGVSHLAASARLLAGQADRAEALLRADVATLSSMSDGSALATTTALLAQAVFAQGRMDEARELCRATDRRAAAEDIATQTIWRGVEARILAREGRHGEAEALARQAVALVEPTDLLSHRGDAMLDLADVLRISGRPAASDRAARAGLALYERKGNVAGAARARSTGR